MGPNTSTPPQALKIYTKRLGQSTKFVSHFALRAFNKLFKFPFPVYTSRVWTRRCRLITAAKNETTHCSRFSRRTKRFSRRFGIVWNINPRGQRRTSKDWARKRRDAPGSCAQSQLRFCPSNRRMHVKIFIWK